MRSWTFVAALSGGTALSIGCSISIPNVRSDVVDASVPPDDARSDDAEAGASIVALDTTAAKDEPTAVSSVTSPAFSTSGDAELVLAFVTCASSAFEMSVSSVTGGGMIWERIAHENAQGGDSEIWRAFASSALRSVTVTASFSQSAPSSSIVLASFRGAGLSTGAAQTTTNTASASAPTVDLVSERAGSLVFAVGNDRSNAKEHVAAQGQTLLHQYLAPSNDTFWVQRIDAPTSAANARVTVSDTAPTSDDYNFVAIEVLPN